MRSFGLSHFLEKILPSDVQYKNFFSYLVVLVFCFFLFLQGNDLFHTVKSSNAYLYGHILDFYDYNKKVVGGNDYFPLLYLIFALWSLPLRILHLTSLPSLPPNTIEVFWSKFLLVLVFFSTAVLINKIAKIITNDIKVSKLTAVIFASAPIAVFNVFIFGQYDILGIFFTMMSLLYYMRKQFAMFAWIMSFAISFKFFALVIFIPLTLFAEKRMIHLMKYSIIAISIPAAQIAMYWNNIAFRERALFGLAGAKINGLAEYHLSPLNNGSVFVLSYLLICLWAYLKEAQDLKELQKTSVFLCLVSYALLFSTVIWHPQWILIITPFFALASIYILQKEKFYLLELVGMLAFLIITVSMYPNNVDVAMIKHGVIGQWLPSVSLLNVDLLPKSAMRYAAPVFFLYLFCPLLIKITQPRHVLGTSYAEKEYFNARFYLGIGIFIISSVLCIFLHKNVVPEDVPSAAFKVMSDSGSSQ